MVRIKQAIGITLFESKKFGGEKINRGGCSPTLRANKVCAGVIEMIEVVNDKDKTSNK